MINITLIKLKFNHKRRIIIIFKIKFIAKANLKKHKIIK